VHRHAHKWKQLFLSRIFILYVLLHSNKTVSFKSHLWEGLISLKLESNKKPTENTEQNQAVCACETDKK